MHKVYITTFQNADNYGAMLQCFALSHFLREKFETKVVNYDNKAISSEYRIIRRGGGNPVKIAARLLVDFINLKDAMARKKSFKLFRNRLLLTKRVRSLDELDLNPGDILVTGSDQVWNPTMTHGLDSVYFLKTSGEQYKKISYAASCGATSSLDGQEAAFKRMLTHFDSISVRENSLAEYIAQLCGNEPFVSIDPTFLVGKEEWLGLVKTKPLVAGKYIFAYTAGKTDGRLFDTVAVLAQKTGYKVVFFDKRKIKQQKTYDGFRWYKAGPAEFLNLLANSEVVVTASFHGLAMATIMNKNMIAVPEEYPDRLLTLIHSAGLEDRIANTPEEAIRIYKKTMNWEKINKAIKTVRAKSSKWLVEAIEGESSNEQK